MSVLPDISLARSMGHEGKKIGLGAGGWLSLYANFPDLAQFSIFYIITDPMFFSCI